MFAAPRTQCCPVKFRVEARRRSCRIQRRAIRTSKRAISSGWTRSLGLQRSIPSMDSPRNDVCSVSVLFGLPQRGCMLPIATGACSTHNCSIADHVAVVENVFTAATTRVRSPGRPRMTAIDLFTASAKRHPPRRTETVACPRLQRKAQERAGILADSHSEDPARTNVRMETRELGPRLGFLLGRVRVFRGFNCPLLAWVSGSRRYLIPTTTDSEPTSGFT
jgi:hypothetical protein